MKMEKRCLCGVLFMMFFFIAGVVGTVSAASVDPMAQLKLEVNLLQQINQLNLTNEQIDKMIPILKNVQAIMQKANTDLQAVLVKEKELLLQRKVNEAEALQIERKVIREKAILQVKTVLVDLQKILTPDQLKRLQGSGNFLNMQPFQDSRRIKESKDEAYLHGSATGMVKVETAKGVILAQKKADTRVTDTILVKLPVETAKIILQKQEQQLKELEAQMAKADEKSKAVWSTHITQLKANIDELKTLIARSSDGTVMFHPQRMGQGLFASDSVKIQIVDPLQQGNRQMYKISEKVPGRMGQAQKGRVLQGYGDLLRTETLSTLIKVLTELRSAR